MRIRCVYLSYVIVVNLDLATDTVTIEQTTDGQTTAWVSAWSDVAGIAPVPGMVLGQSAADSVYVLDYLSQRLNRKM